jgi:ribonuclease Z
MRPLMHPFLVNGRTGDPAVFIETLFEGGAILLDLGDIAALPARKVLRVQHVFVSHAHIDHFVGFDRLLRLNVGREKTVRLWGPAGIIDRVEHKLRAYEWNLATGYDSDLVFEVSEVGAEGLTEARFRLKAAFAREDLPPPTHAGNVIHDGGTFRVSTVALEHWDTVSLAFAVAEPAHVNVWKTRLTELALPVGPWLRELKRAVVAGDPPDTLITDADGVERRLGEIASAVSITAGQKIAYVTDAADTAGNRAAIIELVRGADVLFIDAAFARADIELSYRRAHLSTVAAGEIARMAEVRRVEPFHFSARYAGEDERMLAEVRQAFAGQ